MKPLLSFTDHNGAQLLTRVASDTIYNIVLAPNVQERITIPTGATKVIFVSTEDFYAKVGTSTVTAAVPSGDITDGTGSALLPFGYSIDPSNTHISIISAAICIVSLEFYS